MQTTGRMEIEAKYRVPDRAAFARLLALDAVGDYALRPWQEQTVLDRYLDTPRRDLWHGGYACRVRSGAAGDRWIVTIKGLGGSRGAVHTREEHEVEVPAGASPVDWPPGPGTEIVRRLAAEHPLAELFTVRQQRTLRQVWSGERHVAVLFLDRVEIQAQQPVVTHELEIELTPAGGLDDLHLMGKLLRPFGVHPQPHSKFERALALLDAGQPAAGAAAPGDPRPAKTLRSRTRTKKGPGIAADEPMAEAGRKILLFHFERMLAQEAGTREGSDIEALHAMRVATRRQRAALRIVSPFLRRKSTRPLAQGLRELARDLGAVRDLDVLLETARIYQAERQAHEAREFQPLLDAWSRRRDAARVRMLAHLDGTEYASFKETAAAFLGTPGAGARAAPPGALPRATLVAHVVPGEVWQHYGALRAFDSGLQWAAVEALHAVRIEGKRLRYVLEFFREVLDPCVEIPILAIVALQDHLGELHDADVTIGLVREFIAGPEATARPEVAAAAGHYLESREARLRELRHGVVKPWRTVTGKRFRYTLARAVAAI